MKPAAALVVLGLLSSAPCFAFLGWRDKIPGHWAQKPVAIDGTDSEWRELDEFDGPGLEFRAMNDASNLYLFITADRRDGRAALSGAYRQDVTLWFIGPGKARTWGIRLAFSRFGDADAAILKDPRRIDEEPEVPDLEPELVSALGVDISTAPWPQDISFRPGLDGKNLFYEF